MDAHNVQPVTDGYALSSRQQLRPPLPGRAFFSLVEQQRCRPQSFSCELDRRWFLKKKKQKQKQTVEEVQGKVAGRMHPGILQLFFLRPFFFLGGHHQCAFYFHSTMLTFSCIQTTRVLYGTFSRSHKRRSAPDQKTPRRPLAMTGSESWRAGVCLPVPVASCMWILNTYTTITD